MQKLILLLASLFFVTGCATQKSVEIARVSQ